jgi:hypothetical protein
MGDDRKILHAVSPAALPSLALLKGILRTAVDAGKLIWSGRFDARCKLRGYNIVDVVNVVRQGRIVRIPAFDIGRQAWRIEIADSVEEFTFVVDLALDCKEDYCDSPYVEIVTAFHRRGQSKEVREWLATT